MSRASRLNSRIGNVDLSNAVPLAQRFCRLPYGWDAGWKAAKAAQGSTPALIAVIGDSIGAGQGATNWLRNGWFGKMRTNLLAAAGNSLYGDHYPAAVYGTSLSNQLGSFPYSPRMTTGSPNETGYGRTYFCAASENPSTTFTTPYGGVTGMDLVYLDWKSSTFTYSVDGGAAQTVTCTGPNTAAGAAVKKVSITGLAAGTHTLAIGSGSSGNALNLQGISTFTGPTGIGFIRNAYPGMRFADLTTGAGTTTGSNGFPSAPNDKLALWSGRNPGQDVPTSQTGFGFPMAPDLVILEMGANDCTYGAPLRLYESAFRRLTSALKLGKPNVSIIVLSVNYPDGVSTDSNPGGRGTDYHRYKRMMSDLAAEYGCAFIDIDAKWGSTAYAQGFISATDIHPTDNGHADIANVIGALI